MRIEARALRALKARACWRARFRRPPGPDDGDRRAQRRRQDHPAARAGGRCAGRAGSVAAMVGRSEWRPAGSRSRARLSAAGAPRALGAECARRGRARPPAAPADGRGRECGRHARDRCGLAAMDVRHLAARPVPEMSGGERARVLVARALAQEPRALLADEPAPASTRRISSRCFATSLPRGRRPHGGGGAARSVARRALLSQHRADASGRVVAAGAPEDVLTFEHLAAVYGIQAALRRHRGHAGCAGERRAA